MSILARAYGLVALGIVASLVAWSLVAFKSSLVVQASPVFVNRGVVIGDMVGGLRRRTVSDVLPSVGQCGRLTENGKVNGLRECVRTQLTSLCARSRLDRYMITATSGRLAD